MIGSDWRGSKGVKQVPARLAAYACSLSLATAKSPFRDKSVKFIERQI